MIVNHDQWPSVLDQLEAYDADNPTLFTTIDWHVVHNGPDPIPDDPRTQSLIAKGVNAGRQDNRGYAAAINSVARCSTSRWILALNADLLPMPGTLAALTKLAGDLDASPHSLQPIGVVGLTLLNDDGSVQGSAGTFPNLFRLLGGMVLPRHRRKYLMDVTDKQQVPWVTGAACLFSRACWEAAGGFEESYFMYYEDVDFCMKAWQQGFRVQVDRSVTFRHLYPYHSRKLTASMYALARPSLLRYFFLHRNIAERWGLAAIILCECRVRRLWGTDADKARWLEIQRQVEAILRDPRVLLYPEPSRNGTRDSASRVVPGGLPHENAIRNDDVISKQGKR